jgi:hypothetical protein
MGQASSARFDSAPGHQEHCHNALGRERLAFSFLGHAATRSRAPLLSAPETTHTEDEQRDGWQAILDNFANYVESKGR